jgi:hypothetical protein
MKINKKITILLVAATLALAQGSVAHAFNWRAPFQRVGAFCRKHEAPILGTAGALCLVAGIYQLCQAQITDVLAEKVSHLNYALITTFFSTPFLIGATMARIDGVEKTQENHHKKFSTTPTVLSRDVSELKTDVSNLNTRVNEAEIAIIGNVNESTSVSERSATYGTPYIENIATLNKVYREETEKINETKKLYARAKW